MYTPGGVLGYTSVAQPLNEIDKLVIDEPVAGVNAEQVLRLFEYLLTSSELPDLQFLEELEQAAFEWQTGEEQESSVEEEYDPEARIRDDMNDMGL